MKRIVYGIAMTALFIGLVACGKEPDATNANSLQPDHLPAADAVKPGAESEVKAIAEAKPAPDAVKPAPEPKLMVPAGTKLRVALLDAVSSDKSQAGDEFTASLTQPIVVGGKTVLAKGTRVRGRVVDAEESGRVKGRASLSLTLTQIVRGDSKPISISTKPYTAVAENTKKRDAEVIGGGAGIGAAIGAIAGGGKGAAIGAAVGGGAGTGTVLATKGKEIHYGPETALTFTLENPIEI
jgi:hypothetical protein